MRTIKIINVLLVLLFSQYALAGSSYVSGKITSLLANATNPGIRITGNISPDLCDGGQFGWIYFEGTAEERNIVYGSALALSLAGKTVTVYTNGDGGICRIKNIQVTTDLN